MGKLLQFPPREHDTCPRCGKLNGPFERLGSGRCNDCLSKSAKRRAPKRRTRRTSTRG